MIAGVLRVWAGRAIKSEAGVGVSMVFGLAMRFVAPYLGQHVSRHMRDQTHVPFRRVYPFKEAYL